MFDSSIILVTGGTGSWGYELVSQLLKLNPLKIIVFSRNENNQVKMERAFNNPHLQFCIGDVRDLNEVTRASKGVDYIFHLAALKHVPVCEDQPFEALKTNVIGTKNIIDAAIKNKVKVVVAISTDKAANPSNFYGMTKAMGEKLIVSANLQNSDTKFICVRGGNLLGSNGSVMHLFIKQIKEKRKIGITDKLMTRFFLNIQEAIDLLLKATAIGQGGEIFVMATPACRIIDLAQVLVEASGEKTVEFIELGIRPGEKTHEILYTEFESQSTVVYDEQLLVILPTIDIPDLQAFYYPYPQVSFKNYSSNDALMSINEIKSMLLLGGFIS
ncbi:NAD-dependent epimerase/dehydratase family protein [Paenibacillus psychroresistens]|uniref:NAD-dependent epimerase/dehydratase family protein n=1 Tax=Paenibacillus psychroresistens TaxID=1778678 RepID=A0A6B8RLW0_9BACL|nr:polysaccharide biosynthesis protein [Paenibacillus psychroresistens]QGQ96515.1 NAD-dependent epimerase/dehydratase family protein [Paenibacillus psychroresistens]